MDKYNEYISRDAAICRLREAIPYHDNSITGLERAIGYLRAIPAADVVEVKHGEWEIDDDGYVRCSLCHQKTPLYNIELVELTDYCPYCGAKMDGGKNDE